MDPVRIPVPVDTRAPSGRTNAYLLGEESALLVDPADPTGALTDAVESRTIDHIAVTHTHPDHVGGVPHYARSSAATVWARHGRERRFERATGIVPDRTFHEGTRVGPTTVLETPGHAPDHVAFAWDDAALVGDLAAAEGSVFVGGDDGDMRSYLVSLRRLNAHGFSVLYPGHGPPIADPDGTLTRLLEHRRHREAAILEAVQGGARTTEAIVEVVYDQDLRGIEDLARQVVETHLDKLAVEGRVSWTGRTATPR